MSPPTRHTAENHKNASGGIAGVADTIIFVDYENVPTFDPAHVPGHARAIVFFGKTQTTVSTAFLDSGLELGKSRLERVRVEAAGRNVLDFHLACHLGEALAKAPRAVFVILSKDQGFAPLVRHLCGRGFNVRQVETLEAFAAETPSTVIAADAVDAQYQRVLKLLRGRKKKHLPTSRTKLEKEVTNLVKGKGIDAKVPGLVKRLIKEGHVKEDDKKQLSYTHAV